MSAGAAIGGVIGIFLLIAAVMFVLRWWMRRKRGNARKTILMRQSWYPPGYDGPDHIADTPPPQVCPLSGVVTLTVTVGQVLISLENQHVWKT